MNAKNRTLIIGFFLGIAAWYFYQMYQAKQHPGK